MDIKKYLPIILVVLGILVLVAVYFLVIRGGGDEVVEDDESAMVEVSIEDSPVASLTPTADGHWLNMVVAKLDPMVDKYDAATMDYELLYKLPDGRTQGVPGTVKLTGQEMIESELLLGSESSGKFRYDEGVEQGTFTLRFRNEKGKLLVKFSTGFHMQFDTDELSSADGKLNFVLEDESADHFVTMLTFGVPEMPSGNVTDGPYGIFTSTDDRVPGEVSLGSGMIQRWDDGSWEELDNNEASDLGIFVATSSSE